MGQWSAPTDANGVARLGVTVSMQPGNNYRAGASVLLNALNNTTQAQADGNTPPQDVQFTQMLTIWRKLWVESDSMAPEPLTVNDRGPDWTTIYVTAATPTATTTILTLSIGMTGSNAHQYEGGRVILNAFPVNTIGVVDNTNDTIEIDTVLTAGQISTLMSSHWGTLKDDDPDQGLLPHFYTMTPFIKNAYQDAYVDIVSLPSVYNPNRIVDFDLYLTTDEIDTGWGWNNAQDVDSSGDYWTSLVVAAYQIGGLTIAIPAGARDNDPDPLVDNSTYPLCPCWPGNEYVETFFPGVTRPFLDRDSAIFRATIVDFPHYSDFESQVVAHEIAHSAGSIGDVEQHHNEGGLMTGGSLTEGEDRFFAPTLKRFREAEEW